MTDSTIRQSMISAREEYIGIIRDELLGPGSEFSLPDKEHELISSTPTSRYSVGILFPQGNAVNQDNDETVELEETDNSVEDSGSFSGEDPGTDPVQQKKQRTYAFDETADENLDEEIEMATQYAFIHGNYVHCKRNCKYRQRVLVICHISKCQSSGLYDSLSSD